MLELRNVHKTFNPGTPNETRPLQDLSVTIQDGDFAVVVGTNGSGKTTLQNAIAGAFFVDQGEILLSGINMTRWPEHRRAAYIGRVFQNPFSGTAPDMTIAENLSLAMQRGFSRGFRWALRSEAIAQFRDKVSRLDMGLEDRLDNLMGKLSGGQRQALTLLMATWRRPDLLLLDEHTAALDPKTAARVVELTQSIIERDHLTTIMVTHSMQQAVNMGNRLIMMHRGRIIHDFRGEEKRRLKAGDLLTLFNEVRRREQIDPSVAEMLRAVYI